MMTMRRVLILTVTAVMLAFSTGGCKRPAMPSMVGPNKFRDISAVRKGMSANEVGRIMGSKYKLIYEEGLQGVDGGNYIWEYPEGRVYFDLQGVSRVVNFDK
jgi:hypothetical protein